MIPLCFASNGTLSGVMENLLFDQTTEQQVQTHQGEKR